MATCKASLISPTEFERELSELAAEVHPGESRSTAGLADKGVGFGAIFSEYIPSGWNPGP